MSLKNLLLRSFATIALSASALLVPVSGAAAAEQYITIEPAQPSDTTGKIEVLEFFAYSCSHCNAIEPLIQNWAKTLPENVVFKPVPVAFNASMADLQKLYYSLESMGRLDLHDDVFKAIHTDRKRIFEAKAIIDWAADQGLDRKAFTDVFNSFGVQSKVMRADELAKLYAVDGTPTVAVGGKYVTSPTLTNSYEGTIAEAQRLVEQVSSQ